VYTHATHCASHEAVLAPKHSTESTKYRPTGAWLVRLCRNSINRPAGRRKGLSPPAGLASRGIRDQAMFSTYCASACEYIDVYPTDPQLVLAHRPQTTEAFGPWPLNLAALQGPNEGTAPLAREERP
jgi:hypothetical protein